MYSCYAELFEIEQIIYIKIDFALNNLQRLICYKAKPTNQLTNQPKAPVLLLVSYPEHSFSGGSYPSAEKQSWYSSTPVNWVYMV